MSSGESEHNDNGEVGQRGRELLVFRLGSGAVGRETLGWLGSETVEKERQ